MSGTSKWALGGTPPGMASSTVKRLRYPKDPADVTPITTDWRGVLSAIECDTLSSSFIPVAQIRRNDGGDTDMAVVGTPSLNGDATRVSVWLADGTVGYEYLVSLTVHSVDDQVLTRSFIVPVAWR